MSWKRGCTYAAKAEAAAARAEADRLKAELEAERQNKKNKERATGSQATAGSKQQGDPWLADLESRL